MYWAYSGTNRQLQGTTALEFQYIYVIILIFAISACSKKTYTYETLEAKMVDITKGYYQETYVASHCGATHVQGGLDCYYGGQMVLINGNLSCT